MLLFGRADSFSSSNEGIVATLYVVFERIAGVSLTIGTIFATVVLSLIGVLWGLLVTGTPFGVIMTGIGVISLAGVVVNNAIVLLDYVQQLREAGFETRDALIEAGMTRFRPVVLTALTTMLGLLPMAVGLSVDFFALEVALGTQSAQWWGPMAVAIIFGLAFATVLTLVLVPTMYTIRGDILRVLERIRVRVFEGGADPALAKGQPADSAAE